MSHCPGSAYHLKNNYLSPIAYNNYFKAQKWNLFPYLNFLSSIRFVYTVGLLVTAGLLPLIFLFPEGGKQSSLEIFPLGKKISHLLQDNQIFSSFFWFGWFYVIKQSYTSVAVIYISIYVFVHLNIYLFIHGIFSCCSCARKFLRCLRWC